MTRVFLQDMVNDIPLDILSANWQTFDLFTFSRSKRLWDYQRKAMENAIKVLWRYYEDFKDYEPNELGDTNYERKQKFYHWYVDNGLDEKMDIPLSNRNIAHLLMDYYEVTDSEFPYEQFINRACFWMATGSGKTLVIVKLIEILRELIRRGEIPPHDILILTHRDDLIAQLKTHVNEFNAAHSNLFIHLRELREYAIAKREDPTLFKDRELTVFYYRSDNLNDEQKEKIVDFHNYDDAGKWYVLLDEAHKGDKEDSKRQHIYSILSRNGFLFNFSATFTDPRDLITTVSNFNLSEFIREGYGKHIAILKQEIRAFKDAEDYSNEEKQKIVLKSLIMLTYASRYYEMVCDAQPGMYHKPLLLTLVNSVNTEEADLKLFFRELERIGKGDVSDDAWLAAKDELWEELKESPEFLFEDGGSIEIEHAVFQNLGKEDVLQRVYNASSSGEIEILIRPSSKQELAFKLKTSDLPFALIKIGDISGWLKDELAGYEINERFEDEGYFERLNADDSDINILMGSRSFYEGWDSNRPNVTNFVNIGTGTDAKKFILQSVGRGVRIEPLKNKRKRLLPLYNAQEVETSLFHQIKDLVLPLETLFILGTNRNALQTVIGHLDQESKREEQQLSLFVNEAAKQRKLLIPMYKQAGRPLAEERKLAKFEITSSELELLKRYVEFIHDERVLLALYETEPGKIGTLQASLSNPDDYYKQDGRSFKNISLMVRCVLDYFSVMPKELERLKELEEEIQHFKRISVSLKDISELSQKVETVGQYQDPSALEAELKEKFGRGEITLEEYTESIKQTARMVREERVEYEGKRLRIKHIVNHYYIPIILSDETERIGYIKHIIQTPSEVNFLNHLEQYLQRPDSKFSEFDWWLFSKLDESLDGVYIPYYNPKSNSISAFKPDFIFWLQKEDDYFIIFIDPKSTTYTDYMHKVDGYRTIFEEDDYGRKIINHDTFRVRVFTFLHTDDVNELSQDGYTEYWFDNIDKALTSILVDHLSNGVAQSMQ